MILHTMFTSFTLFTPCSRPSQSVHVLHALLTPEDYCPTFALCLYLSLSPQDSCPNSPQYSSRLSGLSGQRQSRGTTLSRLSSRNQWLLSYTPEAVDVLSIKRAYVDSRTSVSDGLLSPTNQGIILKLCPVWTTTATAATTTTTRRTITTNDLFCTKLSTFWALLTD